MTSIGNKRSGIRADRGFARRLTRIAAFYLSLALTLLLAVHVYAKAKPRTPATPVNPVNPLGLPTGPITNYTRPIRNSANPLGMTKTMENTKEELGKDVIPPPPCDDLTSPLPSWSFTLSESYQFLNDRSRTGGLSSTSDSSITDLTAVLNKAPWTCLDFSYMYSHADGSAPAGVNQTGNQNVGSLTILQPFYPFGHHKPASLTTDKTNDQFAIILSADYGDSLSTTTVPQSPSIRSFARTFLGNALFDYQHAFFPKRDCYSTYPGWLFEFSSGIQFDTIRLHSSASGASVTSSGQQLTYRNIGSVTWSFPCRFGLYAAVEWDAPLYSNPLAGAQPFYANTAVFTGGLVYNIYAYRTPIEQANEVHESWQQKAAHLSHWSASLLYSYTAFNPLVESNQLQVQLSYTF